MKKLLILSLLLCASVCFGASPSFEQTTNIVGVLTTNRATLYVDPINGNDATGKRGSRILPFKTIGQWLNLQDLSQPSFNVGVTGALAAAQSGDTLFLMNNAPFTNNYIALLPNMIVEGNNATVWLNSTFEGANTAWGIGLLPANNCVIRNLNVSLTDSHTYGMAIGNINTSADLVDGTNFNPYVTAAYTNVQVHNSRFRGFTDVVYQNHSGVNQLKCYNCAFVSDWDNVVLNGNNNSVGEFYSSYFYCNRTTNSTLANPQGQARNIVTSQGTNRFFSCTLLAIGTNNVENGFTAVSANAGNEFYGCASTSICTNNQANAVNYERAAGSLFVVGGSVVGGSNYIGSVIRSGNESLGISYFDMVSTGITTNRDLAGSGVRIVEVDANGKLSAVQNTNTLLTPVSLARGGTGASLSDPGANKVLGWDDTDNASLFFTIGANLAYDHATHTLSATASGGSGTVTNVLYSDNPEALTTSGTIAAGTAQVTLNTANGAGVSIAALILQPNDSSLKSADSGQSLNLYRAGVNNGNAELQSTAGDVTLTSVAGNIAGTFAGTFSLVTGGTTLLTAGGAFILNDSLGNSSINIFLRHLSNGSDEMFRWAVSDPNGNPLAYSMLDTNGTTRTTIYSQSGTLYSSASPAKSTIDVATYQAATDGLRTNNIDGKTTQNVLIYTVPAGKQFIVSRLILKPRTVTSLTTGPTISVGKTAATYVDVIAGAAVTTLNGVLKSTILTPIIAGSVFDAGENVIMRVDATSTLATAYNFDAIVQGTLIDQ